MAKSSFFLRGKVVTDPSAGFKQTEIDLGAYVDVLDKAVLRIHRSEVVYQDVTNPKLTPSKGTGNNATVAWQLTTQSKSGIVLADDKSLISSGFLSISDMDSLTSEASNMNPQAWTNGYLVGVDTLYLGMHPSSTVSGDDIQVTVILECTVESMTKEAAMALALSQQA